MSAETASPTGIHASSERKVRIGVQLWPGGAPNYASWRFSTSRGAALSPNGPGCRPGYGWAPGCGDCAMPCLVGEDIVEGHGA
jgi:hypothetical protein